MPVKAPAYKAAEPLFNWTGFYIGGTAGWGWGKTHQTDDGTFLSPPIHWDGFVGGGTLGLNWQSGRSVLGIEADISDARIKGSIPDQPAWGCGGAGTTCHNEVKWFGTVRGRAGYAMDTFLPYVTGGLAYGKLYADFNSCRI
jgi:outer membrane immunogenic protein